MTRIEQEKKTVRLMETLYAKHKGQSMDELLQYAEARLDHCRFGEQKPTCEHCPIHCYRPEMREEIRRVMRWAGPRMLFLHPILTIRHLFLR